MKSYLEQQTPFSNFKVIPGQSLPTRATLNFPGSCLSPPTLRLRIVHMLLCLWDPTPLGWLALAHALSFSLTPLSLSFLIASCPYSICLYSPASV